MTSMELEAYKAELAREILTTNSRNVLDETPARQVKEKSTKAGRRYDQQGRNSGGDRCWPKRRKS